MTKFCFEKVGQIALIFDFPGPHPSEIEAKIVGIFYNLNPTIYFEIWPKMSKYCQK